MNYRALIFVMLICLSANVVSAQFTDDFSDNDLTSNPSWTGDLQNFEVENGQLKLNAPGAGQSAIFTQLTLPDSAVWQIYSHLDFNPSGSNQLRIYLQIDNQDIAQANGYFIEIGETGSDDNLKFYRLDSGAPELIAEGTLGSAATEPMFRLDISRQANGNWEVKSDYTGGLNFQSEVQFFDPTYDINSGWFRIECQYTASRTESFFFDDISVQPIIPDLDAPVLLRAQPIDDSTLVVSFDEFLDAAFAENVLNYSLSPTVGVPVSAQLSGSGVEVELTFSSRFESQIPYTLSVENATDRNGNSRTTQTANFTFFKADTAQPFDLLINEIMADPTPAVGLPDAEFIEIYNRSDKSISLSDITFSDGSNEYFLPDSTILPKGYMIICDDSRAADFERYGRVIPLQTFPALTNSGELISLKKGNQIIHAVEYSDQWYIDAGKDDGGWTLELINPLQPCKTEFNWIASNNLNGGTPAQPNSVLNEATDETFPEITEVFPERDNELLLTFTEGLDLAIASDVNNYEIEPVVGITSATPISPLFNQVRLTLQSPLNVSEIYKIKVSNISDCSGNTIGLNNELEFALPGNIEPGDLVINEILFNPEVGGFDFLEIYNLSGKVLDLSDLLIGNVKDGDTNVSEVTKRQLIFPGKIVAFTENRTDILSRYDVPNPSALIENDLPAFPNDEGNAKLYIDGAINPIIIDDLNYEDDWHHPLLDDEDGVSLERIDPSAATDDSNNWQSAAESVGWATPTGSNSQFKNSNASVDNFFTLNPSSFTPDDDGQDDFLLINYAFAKNGFVANADIYDAAGRKVKTLSQNELLGLEGFLRWDGDTDEGKHAKSGIYIVYIQIFEPEGTTKEFKLPCTLTKPF